MQKSPYSLIKRRAKRVKEKVKSESELPVFISKYTDALQRKIRQMKDSDLDIFRAVISSFMSAVAEYTIRPPSNVDIGSRFSTPRVMDAAQK
jgi:hypothetical protein